MALVFKRTSKWWYALFRFKGRRKAINLKIVVEGRRPDSVGLRGDDDFERSRGRALAEHDRLQAEFESDRTGQKAIENLAEVKVGRKVVFPKLTELADHWARIPRRKPPNDRYATQCKVTLGRFASYVQKHQPDATEFVAVKAETARAFMESEAARGVSPKTWSDTLKLLRATFKHLHPHLHEGSTPFHGLVTKAPETVNREPFSVEQLKAILDACEGDDFIRPIIITGMCTAMRRGDCCTLRWKDVDLDGGFLRVRTAKTGEMADIPIMPMLAEELRRAKATPDSAKFCFPAAEEMYRENPDGITWRVKQVLARALDGNSRGDGSEESVSPQALRARGLEYLERLPAGQRVIRMREVFTLYMDGASLDQVMGKTGASRGTVSNYLNEIERATGGAIVRGKQRGLRTDGLQAARATGKRRASIHDFHSFRVTWITLALAAGVPLELVQRVTGHQTTKVVLKHYFRPGREDFRQALVGVMPKILSDSGSLSPRDEMRRILAGMDATTWEQDRDKLIELLGKL